MADSVDVLVVGAGLGGVASAMAAASAGLQVLLVEASQFVGGQLTAQGVCTPDEDNLNHQPVVETVGATAGYRDLKHQIRAFYRSNTSLSADGKAQNPFNPGRCWVNNGFAVEPSVATQILQGMLSQFANLDVWFQASVTGFQKAGDAISQVTIAKSDGSLVDVIPRYVLDATELGELLPLFGLGFRIGAEAGTGEPDQAAEARPDWIQPITYPIALIHRPAGEDHTIAKPNGYEAVKQAQGFTMHDGAIVGMFTGGAPFWTYRRVIDHRLFADANYEFDKATINVGANDFHGGAYPSGDPATNEQLLHDARLVSRCFTYWLQTECPRDNEPGVFGYRELKPDTSFWGTGDYISPMPYIRESRRINALTIVREQDISNDNPGPRAQLFGDSCGIGNYGMDVHKGIPGMPEIQKGTKPYQIPAGALVPEDCPNLLASCKNIGTTHITNGAYRLHPQEWNIGESAGTLAAYCIQNGVSPQVVVSSDEHLVPYQKMLLARGVPLFWWLDVPTDHVNWAAIQMMGVRRIFDGDAGSLDFDPGGSFGDAGKAAINERVGQVLPWPAGNMSRASAAQFVAEQLGLV